MTIKPTVPTSGPTRIIDPTVVAAATVANTGTAATTTTTTTTTGVTGTVGTSTSTDATIEFAQPLQGNVPIIFLPLRLETRFGSDSAGQPQLWIRAYPDDVHVNSFEPGLTPDELAARKAFLANPDATGSDAGKRLAAWAALAGRFGAARAAWIASPDSAAAASKASDWTQPATTALLPDRLIFTAYDATGAVIRQAGAEIADGLALGPSPSGGDPATDAGLRWLRDFQHAVDLGMAIRLPISSVQARTGFTRVIVYGVKSRLAPSAGPQRLSQAIDAHHYTDGVEILPLGTPTNNADGVKAGYRSDDPGYAISFATERGTPRTPSADRRADGDRLAAALGIPASHFAFVSGSDGRHDTPAEAMNTVLWPATLGYYLENIVAGAVPDADNVVPAARTHFTTWVRGRGPFPTLRIGRQPYGVLPVVSSRAYQPIEGGVLLSRLFALLQNLRGVWLSSSAHVDRVGSGTDPDATLAAILGLSPHSTSYAGRTVLGPQFNDFYWRFVGQVPDRAWFTRLTQLSTAGLGAAATHAAATRLGNSTYLDKHFSLSTLLVAAQLDDTPLADNYLAAFAGITMAQLRVLPPPASPVPLLWLLTRHAALHQYADSAYALLGAAVQPPDRLEPELVNIALTGQTPRVWDQLAMSAPTVGPVGPYLDQHKQDGPAAFVAFWRALKTLSSISTNELDSALREVIDLCSYRLDAWFTSLASQRLDTIRQQPGNAQTLYLGAYGWVDTVRPKTAVPSWGYVHAPSLAHAATAAVLRSGYLAHQTGGSGTGAIDLSSTRTRRALQLLEGVRGGQPLGAQLGYQLERALHEQNLDVYIARFRTLAQTGEIAGDPVVDGLALLDKQPQIVWNGTTFPITGSPDYTALNRLLSQLSDTLDAVSDLMLAEGVHHLVNANSLRAGATVDALARGDTPPAEPDVTAIPRRGGVITHRLLVLLPGGQAAGWPVTPRGQAEPRLDAFAATIMGAASRVRARANLVNAAGATLSTVAITLADTGLGPLDVLSLNGRPAGATGQSGIEQYLARAAWAKRPTTTPAGTSVRLVLDRDPAWPADALSIDELLTVATSTRALLAQARGATATDLAASGQTVDPGIDAAELKTRADAAMALLQTTRSRFTAAGPLDAALNGAAQLGVEGAIPSLDPQAWPAQAGLVKTLLDTQSAQIAALEAGFSRTGAAATALRDHDIARLRIVFGQDLPVIARLTATQAATLVSLFANSDTLLQHRPLDAVTYFSRVARVRTRVAALDAALLYAETLNSGARLGLSVAQLPSVSGEIWAGLPLPAGTAPASRLSVLALGAADTAQAALYVDEWLETIPNTSETTGVTFHVDDAKSRAPQAILLGVPPDASPSWTLATVEGTVLEAIGLAQLRAVDPDTLGAVGHFLPALFFAVNFGSAAPDTIATDLTLAAPPPRVRPVNSVPIIGGVLGRL